MADIFISYSKPDRDETARLAAFLESHGWTVWWDKELSSGEPYRDAIMKQLAAARAVVVLWTPTSIKSDFVRAEAGRAKADGRLIPVRTTDVEYRDIPLPFGEMHTEDASKRELIRQAIVGQLSKPQLQPSFWWAVQKNLRHQALLWFGVIGAGLTLFSSLRGLVTMSEWAAVLVQHWRAWTHAIWNYAFRWMHIEIPVELSPVLTFIFFATAITLGSRLKYLHLSPAFDRNNLKRLAKKTSLFAITVALAFGLTTEAGIYGWGPNSTAIYFSGLVGMSFLDKDAQHSFILTVLLLSAIALLVVIPQDILVRERHYLFHEGAISWQTLNSAIEQHAKWSAGFLILLGLFLAVIPSISPVRRVNGRLAQSLIAALLVLGLNAISVHAASLRTLL